MLLVAAILAAALQGIRTLASVPAGHRLRLAVAGTLLAGLVLLLPIGTSDSHGFVSQRDGTLLAPMVITAPAPAAGASVDIHRGGLLTGPSLATGTVTGTQRCRVPATAASPIRSEMLMPESTCLQITSATVQPAGSTGRITINHPPSPLGLVAWNQAESLVRALITF